ncbi:GAF and ANTAR domain-containing protein [Pseudarthrobacter sp. NS4]|uniref:GAF and ANTAR domain-containing protein n=1 Tax=Pseudarthrobacter sp. NS4 TaxID=2973976 RepID=UPI0021620225|nr:GAF and ANTAR domain-containing protein [Pseudarthrobacter sp. NS4]
MVEADVSDAKVLGDIAAHMQDLVLENPDVEQFLQELAGYAAARLSRAGQEVFCGITLTRRKKPALMAGSNPCPRLVDQLENRFGDGPGITAMRTMATVLVPDLQREERWPEYVQAVGRQGLRSVLSIPLLLEGEDRGVLTLSCRRRGAFTGEGIASAEAFTEQASKGLRLALRMAQLQDAKDGMSAAMQSRTVIDLASGAIMAQNRCSQAAAFKVLREASNTRNMKLRDVAAVVISSVAGVSDTFTYFDE